MQSTDQQATVQDVPLEVLVEIFDYLPKNEYENLALVSKNFYAAICELEKFKYPLEITPDILVNPELYEGVLHSSRRFNYMIIKECLRPEYLEELFAVLDRHGSGITKMKLVSKTFKANVSKICVKIFMKVPRLEELILDIDNLTIACENGWKILPELQILSVKCHNSSFKTFFNSLRPNSLKKLTVNSNWYGFDDFMNRQLAVKDLSIDESNFTQSFERHKLERFTIFVDEEFGFPEDYALRHFGYRMNFSFYKLKDTTSDLLVKLINAHPQLKSFDAYSYKRSQEISHAPLRDDVIKALCYLPSLEKLTISNMYSNVDISDLVQCSAIEFCGELMGFSSFGPNDILLMKNLQKLTIINDCYSYDNIQKSSTLRYLDLRQCDVININEMLNAFERLESLNLGRCILKFTNENVTYPRLKCLKIVTKHPFNGSFAKFLDLVPNLQILHFKLPKVPYNMTNMKKLAAMTYLKELEISLGVSSHKLDDAKSLKALKELCQHVKKFIILLSGRGIGDFSKVLTTEFSNAYKVTAVNENKLQGWMLESS